MKEKRVLILYYSEGNNFGDELLYQTYASALANAGIESSPVNSMLPCREILCRAGEYDFLLFAGGGIIERYVPGIVRYFQEDYDLLRVPYGVAGLSIGEFDYSAYHRELAFWMERASFFYTRDAYSADYLNRLTDGHKAAAGVDTVWSNPCIYGRDAGKNKGINVRDIPYPDLTGDLDWETLGRMAKRWGYTFPIGDVADSVRLLGMKPPPHTVDAVLKQVAGCKTLIAMRYHVILAAAARGIPSIMLAYCPKVRRLAQQLGMEEFAIDIRQLDRLDGLCWRMETEYGALHRRLLERSAELRLTAERTVGEAVGKMIRVMETEESDE